MPNEHLGSLVKTLYKTRAFDLAGISNAGCPISRALCEKWGFFLKRPLKPDA
jgi:hypothetical protein